jgi:hypothetical protein
MRWVYSYVETKDGATASPEQELVEEVTSVSAESATIDVKLDGARVDTIQVDPRPAATDGNTDGVPGLAGNFLLQGTEVLTVPAGTYSDVLKMKLKDANRQYWLAAGIGIIRAVTVSGPPGGATRITKTLKSFNPGP